MPSAASRSVLFLGAIGLTSLGLLGVACSSTEATSTPSNPDGAVDDASPSDDAATEGKLFAEKCSPTAKCAAGLICETDKGDTGFCTTKCSRPLDCMEGATCNGGVCYADCSLDPKCPAGFVCYSSTVCLPDCRKWPDLCPSGYVCKLDYDQYACLKATPPADSGSPRADSGSDSGPAGQCTTPTTTATSGVTGTKQLGSLTAGEKTMICDWAAGRYGGYGCKHTCDGGVSTTFSADASTCSAKIKPGCTATVAQLEECYGVDSADPCALAMLKSPKCAPLRTTACQ
jgi:hypothetical protein